MSDLTDKLQAKREVLRHYTDVLRETREAMGVPLDAALAANGLCERSAFAPEPTHFYCSHCKESFPREDAAIKSWLEPEEFWGASVQREFGVSLCPYCGSEELADDYDTKDTENAL